MKVNKKGFPNALLNRVVLWAVFMGGIGAFMSIKKSSVVAGAELGDLFFYITMGVSLGGLCGLIHYWVYKNRKQDKS